MRHHVFTTAIGFLAAAVLVPLTSTQAAAADPSGYWRKAEQGERPGKMQVFRCGSGKRYICAKIVWLQDPLDSKGKPLRDVRNENPSLRGREIIGLPIINGMAPVGANQWKGNIYNPEDGNTYSATLTLVSRNQIHLKGCKAWLLCGERTWVRTTLPEPEPEEQIEASAEPEQETAAAEPETEAETETEKGPFANAEMLTPVEHAAQPGYRFLNASTNGHSHAGFSGENVPSMFAMTKPIDGTEGAEPAEATEQAEATEEAAAPAPATQQPAEPKPAAQPKPQTIQANAASAPKPQQQAAPRAQPAAPTADTAAQTGETADALETAETETAEADVGEARKLSFRERRQLRRQQRAMEQQSEGLLPWLR